MAEQDCFGNEMMWLEIKAVGRRAVQDYDESYWNGVRQVSCIRRIDLQSFLRTTS